VLEEYRIAAMAGEQGSCAVRRRDACKRSIVEERGAAQPGPGADRHTIEILLTDAPDRHEHLVDRNAASCADIARIAAFIPRKVIGEEVDAPWNAIPDYRRSGRDSGRIEPAGHFHDAVRVALGPCRDATDRNISQAPRVAAVRFVASIECARYPQPLHARPALVDIDQAAGRDRLDTG